MNPFDQLPLMLRQLHPMLAALAMSLSSVSVVTNSLRLAKSADAQTLAVPAAAATADPQQSLQVG